MSYQPSLMVLPLDLRFWLKAHGDNLTSQAAFFFWGDEGCSRFFEKKNWSLTKSPIQIRKFRINVWLTLGSMSCIVCCFWSLIFSSFISGKCKTRMNVERSLILVSLVSVKSTLLKIEDLLCILEIVSLWSPLHKTIVLF